MQICVAAAVSIHSEYDTIIVDPAAICHSVECAAGKREGALRILSIIVASDEFVQICVAAAVNIHFEYDTTAVAPALASHSVECAAEKCEGTFRSAPIIAPGDKFVQGCVVTAVSLYFENKTVVAVPAPGRHSVECAAGKCKKTIRPFSIIVAVGELVQICVIAAVNLHFEYDTKIADPAIVCHSVECAAGKSQVAKWLASIIVATDEFV